MATVGGGTTTLTDVTVSGNSATTGGGVYNNGSILALTGGTVSGNSASAGGGLATTASAAPPR